MAKADGRLRRLIKDHRDWLREVGPEIFERETEQLASAMKEESVHSLTTMSDSLSFLATYHGIKGVIGVVDGDLPSWSAVDRAALYRLWSLKLRFQLFHKVGAAPKLTNDVHKAACCLCYALAN